MATPARAASVIDVHRQRPAVELEFAGVGRQRAGDDLQQGRLAGAIGADQSVDLAFDDVEINVAQGVHGAEALADAPGGIDD